MWVFGYGSLMWDGWEARLSCTRRAVANLPGYRRAFNKLSVSNWGTKADPCPTLNLIESTDDTCRGIAFEFPAERAEQIRAYLAAREGRGFFLHSLGIYLDSGSRVEATVSLYEGKNVLVATDTNRIVRMIARAKGTKGSGAEYIQGVARELAKVGVTDPVVTELARHFPN
jgi:cation transport protein ChaC